MTGELGLLGERVGLRPLTETDVPVLVALFALPLLARWWSAVSEDELREYAAEQDPHAFAVVLAGATVGLNVQVALDIEPLLREANQALQAASILHRMREES